MGHQRCAGCLGRKAEFPCGLTEGMAEALCCRPGSVEVLCCRPGGVEVLCCWFECVGIFGSNFSAFYYSVWYGWFIL